MNARRSMRMWTVAIAYAAGCSRYAPAPAVKVGEDGAPLPDAETLTPVPLSDLRVTSGTVRAQWPTGLRLGSATIRAVVASPTGDRVRIAFVYRGPTRDVAPLASGELRRQIGLKLRARDTCNVVYVMWHIEPTTGIHVSVKSNPGESEQVACGDHGYIDVAPTAWRRDVPRIQAGERHTLEGRIDGQTLEVSVDGARAWSGILPADAFAFDGPVGLRSDNGEFDVRLSAPAPSRAP